MTDKQYEAFSKVCQFIYDMNMEFYTNKEKEVNRMARMNDSEKLVTLKELMQTVTDPLKLLYGMMLVIDPVAVRIATQKVKK